MTIKKRFTAICAAVAIMTSLSAMSASAFTATYYGRATGGSVTNAYVSCLSNGVHPGDIITGIAWTKTSSNKNRRRLFCKMPPVSYRFGYRVYSAAWIEPTTAPQSSSAFSTDRGAQVTSKI